MKTELETLKEQLVIVTNEIAKLKEEMLTATLNSRFLIQINIDGMVNERKRLEARISDLDN